MDNYFIQPNQWSLTLLILVFLLNGCSELNLNPTHVKLLDNGDYIHYFKYSDGCVGDAIKDCGKKELESLNLVPAECAHNIEMVSGGKGENGWAFVTFRCK